MLGFLGIYWRLQFSLFIKDWVGRRISVKTKKGRSTKTALIVKNIKGTVKEKMKGGIGLNLSILEVDRDPY